MTDNAAKYVEVTNYFKERMAESKKIQAGRGKEARIAAAAQKAASGHSTWRQMTGVRLMAHEISHVGNRPFMIGFASVAVLGLWAQTKFTDAARADSEYWSTFHGDGKKAAH
jgi:RsiW-degrading membrane proteinase PrsW (M82 family)